MSKEMNPMKWMGLIILMVSLAITAYLTIRYGLIGFIAGIVICIVLAVLYVLWVRAFKAKTTYEVLKQYVIKKKETLKARKGD